ncbi:hypothetical protein CDL12_06462 [Handroanthus impetiginosus]|uniref:Uncharacterized protein n=1 Tax=Handroanthus impetiginosus TaxID=429701 RepID=A0A2G9HTL1_9LAMI|nr:hypothetical protein CDL12_06462 [Handroanthus impetiginosus]
MAAVVSAEEKGGGAAAPAAECPRFRAKKGSIFPARRRLVKKMVFDLIVQSICSCFTARLQSNRTLSDVQTSGGTEPPASSVFPLS